MQKLEGLRGIGEHVPIYLPEILQEVIVKGNRRNMQNRKKMIIIDK